MTITPHLLAGAAIASATTQSLPVAFLLGFLSHFILDVFPHIDPGTFFNIKEDENQPWPLWIYIFVFSEFIIIWILVIVLFKNRGDFGIILMGGSGAIVVDIFDNNPFRFMRKWSIIKQLHWIHEKFHYELNPKVWYWGLPSELIIIGGSLWYLLRF